jgi:hypothetical protein
MDCPGAGDLALDVFAEEQMTKEELVALQGLKKKKVLNKVHQICK